MKLLLSPITKRNIAKVIPFGLIWLGLGWIFMFIEYAAIGDFDNASSTAIRVNTEILIFASIAVTLLGLLIGTIELVWLNKAFSNKSFVAKIIYKQIFYVVFLFLIIFLTFPIAASMELKTSIFDQQVWQKYLDFLASITSASTFVQMSVSLFLCLIYAEISEHIGQNVLLNFFTGKYHKPKEEQRIFMFLDMKSSTTIAENLGHIDYFGMLKEYYDTFSDAIIRYNGEVYQYIGDEIVVTWEYDKGIANGSCLQTYLAMKNKLKLRSDYFEKRFGVVPSFKAGLHSGFVTTGEIGALKKEIIFTGDVLNTTARIQALCNQFGVDILLSKELAEQIEPPMATQFKPLGQQQLKGRKESIELVTLTV